MNEALTDYEWEGHRGTGISEYLTQMPPAGEPAGGLAEGSVSRRERDRRQDADIHTRPAELLRNLIRFDTTNPPGNERACISYIEGLIGAAGIESVIRARDPERPNLIARLPGRGDGSATAAAGSRGRRQHRGPDVVTSALRGASRPTAASGAGAPST